MLWCKSGKVGIPRLVQLLLYPVGYNRARRKCGQNGFFSAAKTSLPQKHMASMKILKRAERLVNEMTKFLVKMTEDPGVVKPLASGAGFAYNDK